ncbi:hypothetical protein MPSEU_000628600 [Mayamaea pseudoterrestris]|nr:hypothetical protein MPSEU_000628600 [Mayamaea pseudoterrestris]
MSTLSSIRILASRSLASRSMSTQSAAADKLRCVFEEYRLQNYSRETPSRFKKEILNVAKSPNSVDAIPVDALNRILINIGRQDSLLTEEEMHGLLKQVGSKDRFIKASQLLELV